LYYGFPIQEIPVFVKELPFTEIGKCWFADMSNWRKWILAARPKTLPAAIVPVAIGGVMASAMDVFAFLPWVVCLVFALLIQIGTNFANDYYDFLKGADDERRIGPSRAVASGWISPEQMKWGMITTFTAAFVVGCSLILWGGWWLLLVGMLSILCGVAYTGGPYPLGYNGWGDVFVFIFFGWIATGFTYYVQSGTFAFLTQSGFSTFWIWLAGAVPGALASNLLVVNNVRDEPLDREVGKRTLVVRFGRQFGLLEYGMMSAVALIVPLLFAVVLGYTGCFLVLICLPLVIRANRLLANASGREAYEAILVHTAVLLILIGGLFALGLCWN
jgi:1,4-dihydroxy-2-naphthoate octaprenyltransferase